MHYAAYHIHFNPYFRTELLLVLGIILVISCAFGIFRHAPGILWRSLFFLFLFFTLLNPSLTHEDREPLKNHALIVLDDSASMRISNRTQQKINAVESLKLQLNQIKNFDTEIIHIKGDEETDLFHQLETKLASERNKLSGIFIITDGQIHDHPSHESLAPLHFLIAGHAHEIDRQLIVSPTPSYGLVGKQATVTVRVHDEPETQSSTAPLEILYDDGHTETKTIALDQDVPLSLLVTHPGPNHYAVSASSLPNELTPLNNTVAFSINGIRDRLKVLLVSGQPHIGGRVWRDFLKSDPAVDLVHFTILRSPLSFDPTQEKDLALIAFPVHELFQEKLNSFDLVIFDRFHIQSLIQDDYLRNVADYVEHGGSLLLTNATDLTIPTLTHSPLARVLPASPSNQIVTGSFVPQLSSLGKRHPITSFLETKGVEPPLSPWYRAIGSTMIEGHILMTGPQDTPLLIVARHAKGRVAEFMSDQFWLWDRDPHPGGPVNNLLRRTVHWLLHEPELEENLLVTQVAPAEPSGWTLTIHKRDLAATSASLSIQDRLGMSKELILTERDQPGILEGEIILPDMGLYTLRDQDHSMPIMVGPSNTPEFKTMIATDHSLKELATDSKGSVHWLEDQPPAPTLKVITSLGMRGGSDWIGLDDSLNYRVKGSHSWPIWQNWFSLLLLMGFLIGSWFWEGTREH